jgi:hypothetical protein
MDPSPDMADFAPMNLPVVGISLAAAVLTAFTGRPAMAQQSRAVLQLDCYRATGSWTAGPSSDPTNGGLSFGPQPSAEVRYRNDPDPALEAAILDNVPAYRRAVVGDGQDRWARYVHAATDLDGDGRDEVLVYLMGTFFCGTGGCNLQVYRSTAGGYALVSDVPISRLPVVVAETRSNGWRDLWRLESGGGAPSTRVRHGFDGERYREKERIPTEQGLPKGLAVLSGNPTFSDGVVLKPAD